MLLANLKLHTVVKFTILSACIHLNMNVQKPAFAVTLQLRLGKVCSLFVEVILYMLGSDYVKEQEMLSATELESLESGPCSPNCATEKRQIQIAIAYVCFNKALSQIIV